MKDVASDNSFDTPGRIRARKQVNLEPLLRYLEVLGHGSWSVFDEAVKSIAPEVWSTYDVADRLAANAFLEFDWFAERSWQFCRPTLVEARGPSTGFLGERDSMLSPEVEKSSWALFGASRTAARELVAKYPNDGWVVRNKSIAVGGLMLTFERLVIMDARISRHMVRTGQVSLLDETQLRHYLELLPDLQGAAHFWRDGGVPEAAEIVRLEEAWKTQFFQSDTGRWEDRKFDRSCGMWRSEGSVRRYYLVSAADSVSRPSGSEVLRLVDILRVPPELGRWFEALKTRTTGKARIKASSNILEIELGAAVIDLPVLYERWLALSGCRRFVLRQRPKTLRFTNVKPADAATLVRRLHLLLEH